MNRKGLGLSVIFAGILLVLLFLSPDKLPWTKREIESERLAVTLAREVFSGGYKIVSTGELFTWLEEERDMLIVDTMPLETSYKKRHIPGAMQFLFPIQELNDLPEETKEKFIRLLGPDRDRLIVFYCGLTKCARSHNGALWAVKLGYTNIYRCPGGIKAWVQAGYPTETG